ncbi:uncharacterized protein TRIADDRAFT_62278 [Trichoplax adhaerens]|uniref:Uncharacterized protein n=1 Tax=Trichoplax adhaerens TaxID=10228 RepID=B3SDC1_TRIAD|nr:hypothetical protein TRIADDRAFT_62278 [Trichoplax adhaerens]EDV19264.1 hypothetical protein TRIADDRAFT_62278 [Trichoplax adhaerens]|eukprot:XP_002118261.1 hypothetical protein TRIADDRAFT_62278 [Trichoplax adhaerens]
MYDMDKGVSVLDRNQTKKVAQFRQQAIDIMKPTLKRLLYQSETFRRLKKMFQLPIVIPRELRTLQPTPFSSHDGPPYGRMYSSRCMWRILGSYPKNISQCNMEGDCMGFMTQLNSSGYILTHQVIALYLAQLAKCDEQLRLLAKPYGEIESLKNALCSKIYTELIGELKKGLKSITSQDLFLEQIIVCGGYFGYKEFIDDSFIRMILHWQRRNGCFAYYQGPYIHPMNNSHNNNQNGSGSAKYRKLNTRTEIILPDGCFQHTSSLAIGTIAIHLKWLGLIRHPTAFLQATAINVNDSELVATNMNQTYSTQSTTSLAKIVIPLGLTTIFTVIGVLLIIIKSRLGRKYSYSRIPDED